MHSTGKLGFGASRVALKIVVFVAPFIILAGLLYIKTTDHKLYRVLVKEDGFVEYLTSINYFVAFLIGIAIAKTFWKKSSLFFALYLIFSLCLLFFSGEETSWGQRLFKFKPPEFFLKNSFQYEMNLHNLRIIQDLDYFLLQKYLSLLACMALFLGLCWLV